MKYSLLKNGDVIIRFNISKLELKLNKPEQMRHLIYTRSAEAFLMVEDIYLAAQKGKR